MAQLILFNKPWGVLTQFRGKSDEITLADFIRQPGFYPAGRLDKDSEGLLLLTDDGAWQNHISHPRHKMAKTYLVQVEGEITADALQQLRQGVKLKDGITKPAQAKAIVEPDIRPRDPPIRYRAAIPTSWLELTIREGRNRQVRRMTAATGFPTLRLIRTTIGPWSLDGLQPGEWRMITLDDKPTEDKAVARQPARHRRRHRRQ
ncbi:MAG: pseudouridine synthase [Gammaproteobacteria bacterium]|nr:pseudouridine synthase [Gammaproteobacteria bacterium]MDH5652266.1 pseudouridine synthase [Gammaproteobacteria bacterium]